MLIDWSRDDPIGRLLVTAMPVGPYSLLFVSPLHQIVYRVVRHEREPSPVFR